MQDVLNDLLRKINDRIAVFACDYTVLSPAVYVTGGWLIVIIGSG